MSFLFDSAIFDPAIFGTAQSAAPAVRAGGGIPFFRPVRDEEEDEEETPGKVVALKPKRRLKKRELATTVAKAAEYIAAGSPRPMSADVTAARIAALPVIAPLLQADRQRVERAIDRYVALLLAEQEEEEEAVALLLAA